MSAVWIVLACGALLAATGLWAAWPPAPAGAGQAGREASPEPEGGEQPFPMTGAHWLDGFVIFGNTYL
jgi:hypothetical protein